MKITREILDAQRKKRLRIDRVYFSKLVHLWRDSDKYPICGKALVENKHHARGGIAVGDAICPDCVSEMEL